MNQNYPVPRSSRTEYIPDSPISVAFSGPHAPQFEQEEDVLFPYWDPAEEHFRRQKREEPADLPSHEDQVAHWLGAQLLDLPRRQLQHAESAGRFWVMAEESYFHLAFNVEKIHFLQAQRLHFG